MSTAFRSVVLGLLAVTAVGADASANTFKPSSGTKITLMPGQTASIKVGGAQGCKFHVFADSIDGDVAGVSFSNNQKGGHKVLIAAGKVGTTSVFVETFDATKKLCEGNSASYTVCVVPDDKAFVKQYKAKLKAAEKTVKEALKPGLGIACDAIGGLAAAVKSGDVDGDQALDQLYDALSDYVDMLDQQVEEYVDTVYQDIWGRAVNDFGYTAMNPTLQGIMDGGCGDWDKFLDKLDKQLDANAARFLKKFKALQKAVNKASAGDDAELLAIIQDPAIALAPKQPIPVPQPVPQVPPPPRPKDLEQEWSAAGRLSTSTTSSLSFGGSADGGSDVTVDIEGPDGFSSNQEVSVDDDCNWKVKATGLKPGSYNVTITQGGNSSSFTLNVP